jgi:hypothetical protein
MDIALMSPVKTQVQSQGTQSSLFVPAHRNQKRPPPTIVTNTSTVTECLQFPVDKYFTAGSPSGLFLLLKSARLGVPVSVMKDYIDDWLKEYQKRSKVPIEESHLAEMRRDLLENVYSNESDLHPDVGHIYSLFHPHDVIAYRMEPLISRELNAQKPSLIPYTKGGLTGLHVNISGLASKATEDISGLFGNLRDTLVASIAFRRALNETNALMNLDGQTPASPMFGGVEDATSPRSSMSSEEGLGIRAPEPEFTTEELLATLNARKRRLDFSLQENVLENSYLSALAAHFSYWKEPDVAAFLLKEIHEE